MIVMTEPQRADQLVDDAVLVCVQHLLEAAARRDLDGVLAAMHPAARVRVGGSVVAEGLDAVAALVSGEWYVRPLATVTVLDTNVTGGSAYVRSHVRAEGGYLAYSIIDVRDGRVHEISVFVSPLPHHQADPAPDVTGTVVLDLRDDTEAVDLRDDTAVPPEVAAPASRRRFLLPLAAVGSWLVQDLLLAAPVVATATSVGAWRAFVVFAPAYTVLSLVLSLVTVRLLRSPRPPADGRFARWLARSSEHPRVQRWLRASRVLGFVTSAYLFSGPPTVWALHRLGIRRALARYAVLASVIWGVGFVVWYVAIAEVASLLL
jgi:hypothetical protein